MGLTKAEKQILKDFGNDPNYRIETNSRNQIVAIEVTHQISNMQRLINGEYFTLSDVVFLTPLIKFKFEEKRALITNDNGFDKMAVLAVFEHGFLYKVGNSETLLMNFNSVNFVSDENS